MRTLNRVRSRNNLWKFPCCIETDIDANMSAKMVEFIPEARSPRPSKGSELSSTCDLTKLSPRHAVRTAPVRIKDKHSNIKGSKHQVTPPQGNVSQLCIQ